MLTSTPKEEVDINANEYKEKFIKLKGQKMRLHKNSKKEQQPRAPETPYLSARREWNERYGSYINRAYQWRLATFGSIAVALVTSLGLVAVSLQSKVVPYAVEINDHGEVVKVRRADVMASPNANQIRASLRSWVMGARSVYSDFEAMKVKLEETYALTLPDSPAYTKLVAFHKSNNPYTRVQKENVSVEVVAVSPISDTSWQVEWTETTRDSNGKLIGTEQWQATATIAISAPSSAKQIMLNPLGVYVKDFDWTNRLQYTTNN